MAEFAQKRANSAITTLALDAKLCKAHTCNIFAQGKFDANSFFRPVLPPILVDSVASTLRDLKACKATSLDKIPAKILKLSANIIAPSLTFIFNLSLATGTYIDEWKQARVTPIFKSGDRRQCEN